MSTELVLIRHGHAVRVNGDYVNAPLTEVGRTQAELTGLRFCNQEIALDGFYSSPIRRTKETSALIASKISKIPAIQPGIQELEGIEVPTLVVMEFLAHVGWFGKYLYENSGKPVHWPIMGRVSQVITDLVKKHDGGRIAVVTHSGVISSILAWYFPNKRRRHWRYVVDNCSLTRLKIDGSIAELLVMNDTEHLSDALTTKQPPAGTVQVAQKVEQRAEEVVAPKTDGGKPGAAAPKTVETKTGEVAVSTVEQAVLNKEQAKAEQAPTKAEQEPVNAGEVPLKTQEVALKTEQVAQKTRPGQAPTVPLKAEEVVIKKELDKAEGAAAKTEQDNTGDIVTPKK